jgi:hypothetical protein
MIQSEQFLVCFSDFFHLVLNTTLHTYPYQGVGTVLRYVWGIGTLIG